ncbi:TPA: hypothetical protein ACVMZV_005944, partial [Pseudomonas aeruginosa]
GVEMLSDLPLQAHMVDLLVVQASQGRCKRRRPSIVQKVRASGRVALSDLRANDAGRESEVMPGLFLGSFIRDSSKPLAGRH